MSDCAHIYKLFPSDQQVVQRKVSVKARYIGILPRSYIQSRKRDQSLHHSTAIAAMAFASGSGEAQMTPISYQTSDNHTAVEQELADPSFLGPTPFGFAYQYHSQPATFNPSNLTLQQSVGSGHSPVTPLSSVSYPTPYTYPAPPFTVRSAPGVSVSGYHTAQPPCWNQGQTASTQISAGPQSSPPQNSNVYSSNSISRDPETVVTLDAVAVSTTRSPVKNSKSDCGPSVRDLPGKGTRPGRAGTLKCARCRRQKRGSKVSTTCFIRLIYKGSLCYRT